MFDLKVGEEIIKLNWGTYAMKVFGELDGHPEEVHHFVDVLVSLKLKNEENALVVDVNRMFTITERMLIAAYDSATGKRIDERVVDEWIDQLGGIMKVNEGPLSDFVNWVVSKTFNNTTPLSTDTTIEKKNEPE